MAERDGVHRPLVPIHREYRLAGRRIPDPRGLVRACRSQSRARGVVSHPDHRIGVAGECTDLSAGRGVPDPRIRRRRVHLGTVGTNQIRSRREGSERANGRRQEGGQGGRRGCNCGHHPAASADPARRIRRGRHHEPQRGLPVGCAGRPRWAASASRPEATSIT